MEASPTLVRERPVSAVAGSPAAGAALLYERYYDRVFGYCLYQLGSREEAEDVAQTTFMWALRGLRRGVVPRAEASWLFTIAQNACRARHRARGRKRAREVLSDPVTLADMSPAHTADADDLMGLEDALARMPELQRRAILLREWRGLSYKEIASELNLSDSAVETLIFRARRSLADLLSGRPAPKRARRFAFDFGSIGLAVKALLGGGGAAKVAAGLAAAVLVATVAGSTELVPQVRTPRAPIAVGLRDAQPLADGKASVSRRKEARARTTAHAPTLEAPARPAGHPSRAPTTVVGVAEKPLATVRHTVNETVAAVEKAAAPLTQALPVAVELP